MTDEIPEFVQAVTEFKQELHNSINNAVQRLAKRTGVTPLAIRIEMLDTATHSSRKTFSRFVVGNIRVKFEEL